MKLLGHFHKRWLYRNKYIYSLSEYMSTNSRVKLIINRKIQYLIKWEKNNS